MKKKIFVSHTGVDSDWAKWIAQELTRLDYEVSLYVWERQPGGDIAAWMFERFEAADHCLCVCSSNYFGRAFSDWERISARWATITERRNFLFPVLIESCELPRLMRSLDRCDLFNATDGDTAHNLLRDFLTPGAPSATPFPGARKTSSTTPGALPFPGAAPPAQSNIPINLPQHFLGRDPEMAAIEAAFAGAERVAITALQGLRGVGKTTLAAVFAFRHRRRYKATWWIRAETPDTMRADLAALGVRLGWVLPEEKEEPAVRTTLERLRAEGDGVLLLYDNAADPHSLRDVLPKGGAAKILVTANSPDWGSLARKLEIRTWPKETGADFLLARAGRGTQSIAANLAGFLAKHGDG